MYRTIGGHAVLVESVTLGQPGSLDAPALVDEALLSYATRELEPYQLVPTTGAIQLETAVGLATFSATSPSTETVAWPGLVLKGEITSASKLSALASQTSLIGTVVGNYEVVAPWGVLAKVPALLESVANVTPTSSTTTTSPLPPTT